MEFHTLTVLNVHRETSDCVSVTFDIPAHLKETFHFNAGQYLTLRTTITGEDVRRSYSICSAPQESDLRVAIKQVEEGVFSTFANRTLKAGDTLEVMPPQGRFSPALQSTEKRLYVAFAAGSGITPIISILKATLHEEPLSQFILFYGNRGFDQVIFREELEELKSLFPARLAIHHVFSRESMGNDLFQGHIDAEKCTAFAKHFFQPATVDTYFLCGPEEMVFAVKETLEAGGVEAKQIKFELFTTNTVKKAPRPRSTSPSLEANVTVIQDGVALEFLLPSDGSALLDAAMRAGVDLPFSCKGGVCSTCKAKVLEGEVEMDLNYGLEPDEVAAGYVLTCQSHPKTQKVVISFDE